jgi:hypothetical protein
MRAIAAAALMSLAIVATDVAAQRPDFSGRWVPAGPTQKGQQLRIVQNKGTLRVTSELDGTAETVTYNLDGTPRREPSVPSEERWSTAAWRNGTLVLTDTRMTRTSERRTEYTLSFDSAQRLILGRTTMQVNADRDPAAPLAPQRKTVIVLNKRR